jgi:hypothetical protein
MNRWRVGEDRGSQEMDGCPLTPWFENIKMEEEPRWLCGLNQIGNKKHPPMVITLENQNPSKN